MNSSLKQVKQQLVKILSGGSWVIIGLGNQLKGDDGVGMLLTLELQAILGEDKVWCAGMVLENYLIPLEKSKPDVVIIIDSMDSGKKPGAISGFFWEELSQSSVFTHNFSLAGLGEFLDLLGIKYRFVLGIQPKTFKLGSSLSPEVKRSKDQLRRLLLQILKEQQIVNH